MKPLFFIPARGGSKGVPGKNIKQINGKPLIAWTILNVLKNFPPEDIFVSTDDKEIAAVAESYGVKVPFLRPAHLATDASPTIDSINHLLEYVEAQGKKYDVLVTLEPTSPLRKKDDLKNALLAFEAKFEEYDSVVSLGEVQLENPFITKIIEDGCVKNLMEGKLITRRQDYPTVYFPYGVIYGSKIDFIKSSNKAYGGNMLPYFIERWQNYELDDIYDFVCIEQIIKLKENEIL